MIEPDGEIEIRQLREDDFAVVTAEVRDWWQVKGAAVNIPRFFFQHFGRSSLVASCEGRLCAFVIGFFSPDQEEVAYINFLGVNPQLRRHGLAGRLYARFFELARAAGRREVHAITPASNEISIAFHRAQGFQLVDSPDSEGEVPVHRNYNERGDDYVLFRKRLADEARA